jgi:dCMP deaminase
MCDVVAKRATCDRKHVGAVLVRDNRVIATGYNGSIPGLAHCDDVGHDMDEGHCVRTVHAEVNVICQAAKLGISTDKTVLYCNTLPCWNCFKVIASSGIKKVVYRDEYRGEEKGRVKVAVEELSRYLIPGFQLVRYDGTA